MFWFLRLPSPAIHHPVVLFAHVGSCYSTTLRDRHCCIENSMKNNCPICYEVRPHTVCTLCTPSASPKLTVGDLCCCCCCKAVPVRFAEGDVGAPLRPHHAPGVLPRDVEARQVSAHACSFCCLFRFVWRPSSCLGYSDG